MRAHLQRAPGDLDGNVYADLAVYVYEPGTTTEVDVYAAAEGGAPLTQPLISNAKGEIEAWAEPQTVDLYITDNGGTAFQVSKPWRKPTWDPFRERLAIYADPENVTADHGELTGLDDDDHPHYWNDERGNAAVASALELLVGTAGAALDTLGELSDALGDDADFAGTVTTLIAGIGTDLTNHAGDTTNVHGIADTSALALLNAANVFTGGNRFETPDVLTPAVVFRFSPGDYEGDFPIEWRNSDTNALIGGIDSGGGISASALSEATFTKAALFMGSYGNNAITILTRTAANVGLQVRGAASQTANLQEWQDSAASVLTHVRPDGGIVSTSTAVNTFGNIQLNTQLFPPGGALSNAKASFKAHTTTAPALVLQGLASQTGNLQEWQTSAAAVRSRITAGGMLEIQGVNGEAAPPIKVLQFSGAGGRDFQVNNYGEVRGYEFNFTNTVTDSTTTRVAINASGFALLANSQAATVVLRTRGAASQSANLQEWQDSASAVLARVDSAGFVRIGADISGASGALTIRGASSAGTLGLMSTDAAGFSGVNMYDDAGTLGGSFQIGNTGSSLANIFFFGNRKTNGVTRIVHGSGATRAFQFDPTDYSLSFGSAGDAKITRNGANDLRVDSHWAPSTSNARDLGTSGQRWKDFYFQGGMEGRKAILTASIAADVPLLLKGAASQSGNLLEVQDSAGAWLGRITAAGLIDSKAVGIRVRNAGDTETLFELTGSGKPNWQSSTLKQTTIGAAGGAAALPATPEGYVLIQVVGSTKAVPYYATS